ncbi:hypothetical protein MMC06_001400 [Schaereria dolodes]|nr:hypothetical protein [Schaereria dolodes]
MKASIASIVLFLSLAIAIPVSLPLTQLEGLVTRGGDTAPAMTDVNKDVVPFDSKDVVTRDE